jgi:hypothetical protein
MTNKTDNLITELETSEIDFYAKLVPSLLKELSTNRKLLQTSKLEHNKTKETLEKVYKDYQASYNKQYKLIKAVQTWKAVSVCLLALLLTFIILGAI